MQEDGEYPILFAGKVLFILLRLCNIDTNFPLQNVSIYCHHMRPSTSGGSEPSPPSAPREYVTLPRGERENYSEIYGLRLVEPRSCPKNGSRDDSCACVRDARRREGLTVFSKIRVNVTSLKVNSKKFPPSKKCYKILAPLIVRRRWL